MGGLSKFRKVPPALAERFDALLPRAPGVERRQMFGCPCAFVNGNMFAGLHEERLIVRMLEPERGALISAGKAGEFTVLGRTMREYVAIVDALARPAAEFGRWLERGLVCARALPVKRPKKKTRARI